MFYKHNAIIISVWASDASKQFDSGNTSKFTLEIPLSHTKIIATYDGKSTRILIESQNTDDIKLDNSESSTEFLDNSPRLTNKPSTHTITSSQSLSHNEILTLFKNKPSDRKTSPRIKAQTIDFADLKSQEYFPSLRASSKQEEHPILRMVLYHLTPANIVNHYESLSSNSEDDHISKPICELLLELLAAGNLHGTKRQGYSNSYYYGEQIKLSDLSSTFPAFLANAKKVELTKSPETAQWDALYPNLTDHQYLSPESSQPENSIRH